MVVEELVARLGFEVDHAQLAKIEQTLEGIKHRLEFLAAAEVAHALFEITERFSKFAEELHIASQTAGVSVESFQKLAFAAQQSGVSQDELTGSMQRLSRAMYAAKMGSSGADLAFRKIGITDAQLRGFKDSKQALLAVADGLKTVEGHNERMALSQKLLGQRSANVTNFLSKGSKVIEAYGDEAEALGAIIREDQIEALVNFEHAMVKVWNVVKVVGATIGAALAPSLEYVITLFLDFWKANHKLITDEMVEWIHRILYGLGYLYGSIELVVAKIMEFAEAHPVLTRLTLLVGGVVAGIVILSTAISAATAAWAAYGGIMVVVNGVTGVFAGLMTILTGEISIAIAIIAALTIAFHDLWVILSGGNISDTWVAQLATWVFGAKNVAAAFDGVRAVFSAIYDIITDIMNLDFGALMKDVMGDVSSLGGFLKDKLGNLAYAIPGVNALVGASDLIGTGGSALASAQQKPSIFSDSGAAAGAGNGAPAGGTAINMNAPITINAHGADPETVGKHVQEGVREHLDRVHREADRSLQSARAY